MLQRLYIQLGHPEKPVSDAQVAIAAMGHKITERNIRFILSQTTTAQAVYQQQGLEGVSLYLDRTIVEARQVVKVR